jgi:hypothetical protein
MCWSPAKEGKVERPKSDKAGEVFWDWEHLEGEGQEEETEKEQGPELIPDEHLQEE